MLICIPNGSNFNAIQHPKWPIRNLIQARPDNIDWGNYKIGEGSYKTRMPPEIRGTGYVVDALEAALWAFNSSDSFKEGALLAVNLGDDADTTGAIYGQIAGAHYGLLGMPADWLEKTAQRELVTSYADGLLELSYQVAE